MKNRLCILLAAVFLLSLCACGTGAAAEEAAQSTPAEETVEVTAAPVRSENESVDATPGETPPDAPEGTPPDGGKGGRPGQ